MEINGLHIGHVPTMQEFLHQREQRAISREMFAQPSMERCPLAALNDTGDAQALADHIAMWHDYPSADALAQMTTGD